MSARLLLALALGTATAQLPAAVLSFSAYDPARSSYLQFNLDNVEQGDNAGVMLIQIDGGPTQFAFCGDLFTGIAENTSYDANGTLLDAAPYSRVAWLMANAVPALMAGGPSAQVNGAALQLAIWDILHDGGDGLQAGRIQQSANTGQAVLDAVGGYLAASWAPGYAVQHYQLTFQNTNFGAQDLLVAVPEPGTFAVAGLALAALAWRRRRA